MSDHVGTQLVMNALEMALGRRWHLPASCTIVTVVPRRQSCLTGTAGESWYDVQYEWKGVFLDNAVGAVFRQLKAECSRALLFGRVKRLVMT